MNFPAGAPAAYAPGDHVTFDVSGWSFTNAVDTKDTEVVVKLGATTLGTAPLDNAAQAALPGFDIVGKASVDVVLPAGTPSGAQTLTLVGTATGTEGRCRCRSPGRRPRPRRRHRRRPPSPGPRPTAR